MGSTHRSFATSFMIYQVHTLWILVIGASLPEQPAGTMVVVLMTQICRTWRMALREIFFGIDGFGATVLAFGLVATGCEMRDFSVIFATVALLFAS